MFKNFRVSRLLVSLFLFVPVWSMIGVVCAQRLQAAAEPQTASHGSDPLKVLQWRSIGPFRGGRVTAVAGVASQPMVFYFGATGGGVWKTVMGASTGSRSPTAQPLAPARWVRLVVGCRSNDLCGNGRVADSR
jgi:hypothetical protein